PEAAAALETVANDRAEPEIVRASALARLASRAGLIAVRTAELHARDTSGLVRRAALNALEETSADERLRIAAPLLDDSLRAVRLEAAWILASVSSQLGAA